MNAALLLADDHAERRRLGTMLRHGHFDVKAVSSVEGAAKALRRRPFAAVVVADLDGVAARDAVAVLRPCTDAPIIAVSRRADEWGMVPVLDAGADDYLAEPFGAEELLARMRAALRLFARATDEPPVVTDDFTVYVHDRRFVAADGSEVALTSTEWRILEVLLRHPGHLVSQAEVLRAVWGPDAIDKTQYLRVYMASIRRKVEPEPARPRYFVTAPGLGLKFVPSVLEVRGSAK